MHFDFSSTEDDNQGGVVRWRALVSNANGSVSQGALSH